MSEKRLPRATLKFQKGPSWRRSRGGVKQSWRKTVANDPEEPFRPRNITLTEMERKLAGNLLQDGKQQSSMACGCQRHSHCGWWTLMSEPRRRWWRRKKGYDTQIRHSEFRRHLRGSNTNSAITLKRSQIFRRYQVSRLLKNKCSKSWRRRRRRRRRRIKKEGWLVRK